jgi:2-oxoglutarate ferredoxin oxidoreductase subunit delta
MRDRKFEVVVLEHFCKGCGLCVEHCKQGKLYIVQKPNKRGIQIAGVRAEGDCTGCLQCATICPDAALEITPLESSGSRTGTKTPVGESAS